MEARKALINQYTGNSGAKVGKTGPKNDQKRAKKMIKNEPKISPIFWKNRRRGLELEKDPQKSWKSIQH